MEFPRTSNGKRVYPSEFKRQVLSDLESGQSAAEVARRHLIPVQNILKWKSKTQVAGEASYATPVPAESVPVSEYRRLLEENRNLKKSLANMTMDRDRHEEQVDKRCDGLSAIARYGMKRPKRLCKNSLLLGPRNRG
jgi:transposase-like protein